MTVRDPIFDEETGERIPFSDFKDIRKLHFLVPEPDCDTRGGKIIAWRDSRPQPTYDEIEAVTDEQVAEREIEDEENNFALPGNVIRALARVAHDQENRVRALEGKAPVTFRQFARAVKTRFL